MNAIDLLQRLWMATLAATAALALVGILRRPWRRAFGAEQACRLWWLPVLAVIASQLPHPAHAAAGTPLWISVRWEELPSAPTVAAATSRMPWMLLAVWLAGVLLVLGREAVRQIRFMRRLGRSRCRVDEHEGMVLWRLPDAGQGPALIGCWRPRIVLPADFERRYDAAERDLILAHERMHARRRDLPGLLLGVCLRALFWFHPLAWWAVRRLRQDQELACDAAMLRTHIASPRRYADTLLKTQLASPVHAPIGCAWHTHPVKERITMLKYTRPTRVRRGSGALLVSLLGIALVGTVYAHTAHQTASATPAASARHGVIRSVMKKVSVRDAATKVAAVAGYVVDNPEALSTRAVTFKFKDMDGRKALKLLARVDGKQAVFKGNHVRIESH